MTKEAAADPLNEGPNRIDPVAVERALRSQSDPDADDLSLIRVRLRWTPEERLLANAAFIRFCLSARPQGPLLRD